MIVLLGASGFVGSAIRRLLDREELPCRCLDVEDYGEHRGERCTVLINAAGSSVKFRADTHPLEDFKQSVELIVRSVVDYRPELYVLISSVDVYDNLADPEKNREDSPIRLETLSTYGFHKRLGEICLARHAGRRLIFRLAGMVGPGLRKNPVYDILHGQPLRIHPDSQYQFMSTDAVAGAVWQIVSGGAPGASGGGIYNICGRGVISPRAIAGMAGKALDLSLLPDDSRPRVVHVNTEKASLLTALPDTVQTVRDFLRTAGD